MSQYTKRAWEDWGHIHDGVTEPRVISMLQNLLAAVEGLEEDSILGSKPQVDNDAHEHNEVTVGEGWQVGRAQDTPRGKVYLPPWAWLPNDADKSLATYTDEELAREIKRRNAQDSRVIMSVDAYTKLIDDGSDLARARDELIEALRLTVEYVGLSILPPLPGWCWYDAMSKHAPDIAARFRSSPT